MAVLIFSYVVGSLNSAIITVYLFKRKDIREYGSKNAGFTNVTRCFGVGCGVATFLFDLAKGFVVVGTTRLVLHLLGIAEGVDTICLLASMLAFLGHIFPAFYGFKGGKGILIAATCMLAIRPWVFLGLLVVFLTSLVVSKYVSVSSILCCLAYPLFNLIYDIHFGAELVPILVHLAITLSMGALAIVKHGTNIKRLLNHTESKVSFKKEKE